MPPGTAFPAANASMYALLKILVLKTENQNGAITVHTVWLVSANVPTKRLNTENIARGYPVTFAQNRYKQSILGRESEVTSEGGAFE